MQSNIIRAYECVSLVEEINVRKVIKSASLLNFVHPQTEGETLVLLILSYVYDKGIYQNFITRKFGQNILKGLNEVSMNQEFGNESSKRKKYLYRMRNASDRACLIALVKTVDEFSIFGGFPYYLAWADELRRIIYERQIQPKNRELRRAFQMLNNIVKSLTQVKELPKGNLQKYLDEVYDEFDT